MAVGKHTHFDWGYNLWIGDWLWGHCVMEKQKRVPFELEGAFLETNKCGVGGVLPISFAVGDELLPCAFI
jgi:hypothetical protein